ncbi:hypothetical protein [Luteibacter yeojuensis]|uniref:Uncharacterized protein n=1 Tax=Luteibacter yeojuensis TaxID=345309 RepID=A0A0F3KL09_9GAMM|nr:hypothetical protein [Luteibacter yeojuensis]KJV31647.1 hypothetical protein VI08_13350 [Luteibacter yeojuensis]
MAIEEDAATTEAQVQGRPGAGDSTWTLAAWAVVALGVLIAATRHVYSSSVDVAHHYALVHWLFEHWEVKPSTQPILGEMSVYPRYSHIAAAMLARVVGSPFLAMQLMASAALVAAWSSIAFLPKAMGRHGSWALTVAIVTILAVNHYTLHIEFFGHELLGNYFYSQLVAQALLLAILVAAARYEFIHGFSYVAPVAIIIASLAIAGVHLLPAVEGIAYGLLLLLVRAISERQTMWPRLASVGATAIIAAAALYKHPAFAAMRGISENNGDLPLTLLNSLPRLVALAIIAGLASLALLITSFRNHKLFNAGIAAVSRHVACAGLAISALFALQVAAFAAGYGSEYAYRKYGFALASFLLLDVALIAATVYVTRGRQPLRKTAASLRWMQPALITTAFWCFNFSGSPVATDTAPFLTAEAAATQARQMGVLQGTEPAYARGLPLGTIGDVAAYLVTIGIFESERYGNGYATLRNIEFPDPGKVGSIFTSTRGNSVWTSPDCVRTRLSDGYVVSDGACVLKKFSNVCQASNDLSSRGFVLDSAVSGFSHPEDSGRWTEGKRATFTCVVGQVAPPHEGKIVLAPFNPDGRSQTVNISINGTDVAKARTAGPTTVTFNIPTEVGKGDSIKIDLSLPDAISPRDAGVNSDSRTLGVFVKRIDFD